jgi:hypothetical protein
MRIQFKEQQNELELELGTGDGDSREHGCMKVQATVHHNSTTGWLFTGQCHRERFVPCAWLAFLPVRWL